MGTAKKGNVVERITHDCLCHGARLTAVGAHDKDAGATGKAAGPWGRPEYARFLPEIAHFRRAPNGRLTARRARCDLSH
jgi:hypothetical protein